MRLTERSDIRGSSEPPREFNPESGLRKNNFPIRLSGVLMRSQDNLTDEGNDREILRTPFGHCGQPISQSSHLRRSKRRSSVGDIVAALEAEIRTRKESSLGPRSRNPSEERNLILGYTADEPFSIPNSRRDIFDANRTVNIHTSMTDSLPNGDHNSVLNESISSCDEKDSNDVSSKKNLSTSRSTTLSNDSSETLSNDLDKKYELIQDNERLKIHQNSKIVLDTNDHSQLNHCNGIEIGNKGESIFSKNKVLTSESNKPHCQSGNRSSLFELNCESYWNKTNIKSYSHVEFKNPTKTGDFIDAPSSVTQDSPTNYSSNLSVDKKLKTIDNETSEMKSVLIPSDYRITDLVDYPIIKPHEDTKHLQTENRFLKENVSVGMPLDEAKMVSLSRNETPSTIWSEAFSKDLIQTDMDTTSTITGLEDEEYDDSSEVCHSLIYPRKINGENSYPADSSDELKVPLFNYKYPRIRRKSASEIDSGITLRNKRKRNRTIAVDSWQGTVCQYTQKTYVPQEKGQRNPTEKQIKNSEQDLELGLEIIIDRLRNIETKLDALKTMDQNNWNCFGKNTEKDLESLIEKTNETTVTSNAEDSSMLHYAINCQTEDPLPENNNCDKSTIDVEEQEDDETLKEDDNESILTDKTEIVSYDDGKSIEEEEFVNYQITSPPSSLREKSISKMRHLEIMSLSSLDEDSSSTSIIPDLEEEEDEKVRAERINNLAKRLLEDVAKIDSNDERPSYLNLDLDTVSERSEEDAEYEWKTESRNKSSHTRRARSASRERQLTKIKYCWRCHNTGHESYNCKKDPQPGSWCPRCLEASHWEDQCWVNETEVFCNVCSLPGHLPCVHRTSDFRQRKLVIETFGWLTFKEWFREAEFWSWWNCSGYTNVPLYKLMQHRPDDIIPE